MFTLQRTAQILLWFCIKNIRKIEEAGKELLIMLTESARALLTNDIIYTVYVYCIYSLQWHSIMLVTTFAVVLIKDKK